LIAAAATAHRLTVLHDDRDFDKIVRVTGQCCDWAVPAGSID
jgi:predicted nucleic acid-binding protein